MMNRLIFVLMSFLLAGSLIMHVWEYRKIREHADMLTLQAEIETKRTSLMVIYQEVLINMAKELDAMRENKTESFDLKWEGTDK